MQSKKRTWGKGLILTIFGVSLVLNVVSIRANFGQRNKLNTSEAKSLGHVVAEMRQANDYFQNNKPYAVAMLTEVAGTLMAP